MRYAFRCLCCACVFVAQGFTTARTSLVEMFIIAQADQLFISPHSTFSTTAAALSGVRVLYCCVVGDRIVFVCRFVADDDLQQPRRVRTVA